MTRTHQRPFPAAERQMAALGQRLRLARLRRKVSTVQMAERMGVSRSTLNTLENTGKASVIAWIKLVQCLGQEGQLQPLFRRVITSIAEMEQQQIPARQRVSRTRHLPKDKP